MPAKNALKPYYENGYYHIYNRGVAKGLVFLDHQDYLVFMSYLKEYLSPPRPPSEEELLSNKRRYLIKNYHDKIVILAFGLMPNHFHLIVKQTDSRVIEFFMRSLLTRFAGYFNKRHDKRVGHLFQDVYKGRLIEKDEDLWWLSRYIHRNPQEFLKNDQRLADYPYSSYSAYLGLQNLSWVDSSIILSQIKNYQDFVEVDNKQNENVSDSLAELSLENEDAWV